MGYKPVKFPWYQCNPTRFWSKWEVNETDGISLGILRLIHDRMWQTDTQPRSLPITNTLHRQLRITKEQLDSALSTLIANGLLTKERIGSMEYLRSEDIDYAMSAESEFRGKKSRGGTLAQESKQTDYQSPPEDDGQIPF